MKKGVLPYILFPASAVAVGAISSVITNGSFDRFSHLRQPPLSPPEWLFPIVWTILYILMGVAAARIYRSESPAAGRALVIYCVQLFMAFLWPIIFFKFEARLVALIELGVLIFFIIRCMMRFLRIDKSAGLMLLPYMLWSLFAFYLNAATLYLNG